MDFDTLPDGTAFPAWDDATQYRRVLHVAQCHPNADDANSGTQDAPLKTIGAAASRLKPCEKALIHEGIYRETVCPPVGGEDTDRMIAYEAAPGEKVVVTATEIITPDARPSTGWRIGQTPENVTVWMTDLPENIFAAYNPFLARNAYDYIFQYGQLQDPQWMQRALLRRGSVIFRGRPLKQVFFPRELAASDGAFWVEEPGLRIHFRLPGDVAPEEPLEISVREQTFAPREAGLAYIRISGIELRNAADGLPVPQRGSVSTYRGNHWIIEDCIIDGANGVGISLGAGSWNAQESAESGYHIVRRNNVRNCGVCGIAGARGVVWSLLENNCFEFIGYQDLERMYECAGIKFHFAENCLIRNNIFRHLRHAGGIWLDVDNINNRITRNVFADIHTVTAAVYSEMNYERNMIDHNVIWDIQGHAIHADCNEFAVIAHNLFGNVSEGWAVLCSLSQAQRKSSGRTGLCRANQVINNIIYRSPQRVEFGRREQNVCDGNLYDIRDDSCSFHIAYPEPGNWQKLSTWQSYFDFDRCSTQVLIAAEFNADTLEVSLAFDDEPPVCIQSKLLGGGLTHAQPGPFTEEQWQALLAGEQQSFGTASDS